MFKEAPVKEPIWRPPAERISNANMTRFIAFVNEQEGKRFSTYEELYRWSIENIPAFWTAVWDFYEVKASKRFETVVDDLDKMPGARWFIGS
jgi:acetoacetyl-CoA synthetase